MNTPSELHKEYKKNLKLSLEIAQALRNSFADHDRLVEIWQHIHKYESLVHLYKTMIRRNNASI